MIDEYKLLNNEIQRLNGDKKDLEMRILSLVKYNQDGQKTIPTSRHKICVKAGHYYKVSAEVDFIDTSVLPFDVNPFKQKIVWELDKKKYEILNSYPNYKSIADAYIEMIPKPLKLEVL